MRCAESGIDLRLEIDASVPAKLLGNTFLLRQALTRVLKNPVDYTKKGRITVRVRAINDMSARFNINDLSHIPIHLIIEVEDTGRGFIITESQKLLDHFAKSTTMGTKTKPIISLKDIDEVASMLNGSINAPQNSINGTRFVLTVQLKLVSDAELNENIISTANISQNVSNPSFEVNKQEQDLLLGQNNEQFKLPKGPLSVIIGDSGISEISNHAKQILSKAKFKTTHLTTASAIFKELDKENHGYSAIFLRELSDVDIIYAAIRVRYLERSGTKPIAIILIAEDIVQADMDVLRYFNISTVNNFARDAEMLIKVTHLALRTQGNKIFQDGKFFDKTKLDSDPKRLFDSKKAMENSKQDKKLVQNICSMWVRFYPVQLERLNAAIESDDYTEQLRVIRTLRNSAGTVCLPMLWAEANRLEQNLNKGQEVRYEKLLSIYEQSYELVQKIVTKAQKERTSQN